MINSVNSGVPQKFVYLASEAPAQMMVTDVLAGVVGKMISLPDFAALAGVCRGWQAMLQPNIEKKLLEVASFGKDKWLSIPGVRDVGEEPALTEAQIKGIIAKLKGTCVFFNEPDSVQPHRFQNNKIKKMWQTHMLILFTETINGEPRTVNCQNKLFHFIKEKDDGTAFEFIIGNEKDPFRNQPAPKSFWGLVPLDVIPGSRGTSHEVKENLLKNKGYRVLTPNDGTTSNCIMNLEASKDKKGYYFGREGKYWTYIATTELYNTYRLVVGAAAPSGPRVSGSYDDYDRVGAAGVSEVP
jgi:hypothetical protein